MMPSMIRPKISITSMMPSTTSQNLIFNTFDDISKHDLVGIDQMVLKNPEKT